LTPDSPDPTDPAVVDALRTSTSRRGMEPLRRAVTLARRVLVRAPARRLAISVCIPAYEMHGYGTEFLARSLAALDRQTLRDFEVVVSDHSQDSALEALCRDRRQPYALRYLRCPIKRGNPTANTNFAARHAEGAIIKLLHQDDFLFRDDALERIVRAMGAAPDRKWGGAGCIHVNETESRFYDPHLPRMDPAMLQGNNKFGAPSLLFVRREDYLDMDEELIFLNDCELYYRLAQAHGEPLLIDELLVAVRQWPKQVTHTVVTEERKLYEARYATEKHASSG
jgi:glycosyltransferase involved in cell wall biosynthesis